MPELPEVETTRRGIEPHLVKQQILHILVRQAALRWPIPQEITQLKNQSVISVQRRAKYLLLELKQGWIIIHLGMSGSLRVLPEKIPAAKHDHVDLILTNGKILRYTDPRRFGCWLWSDTSPLKHKLLQSLGPEPLEKEFSAEYLFAKSRKKTTPIKPWLMDNKVVVGVGNIYASESLFRSGISPKRLVSSLTLKETGKLVAAIKQVLKKSIEQGGSTISDFLNADGKPGYFVQKLKVYDRSGQPCLKCGTIVKKITQAQRSTFFCPHCQH